MTALGTLLIGAMAVLIGFDQAVEILTAQIGFVVAVGACGVIAEIRNEREHRRQLTEDEAIAEIWRTRRNGGQQ